MSKALTEKRNDCVTEAESILATAKAAGRTLTDDEAAKLENLKEQVRSIDRTLAMDEEFRKINPLKEKQEEKKEEGNTRAAQTEEEQKRSIEISERNAFENYLRNKIVHERDGELSPASGSGEKLIPTTIVNYIIRKVYDISPILQRSQKFNVPGKLDVPFYPADSNNITVAYQTEFSPLSSSSGGFDTVELGGFLAGALTKVSKSLINNLRFDIVGFVVDEMARAIRRFIEKELLNPSDPTHKVTGLSTLSNSLTAAAANAFTADDLVKLHDKVKDEFQQNACWIMHPETRTAARMLKANNGYYLLNDDISTPFGTSILGKPVFVSDNMPKIGTGNTVVYYGDMRGLATKFSEEINIEVLREKYADEHALGVIGWFEFDSKVIDEQQIAKLVMA